MPNGKTYENWLKDKEGRGEDGKNGSSSQRPLERTSEKAEYANFGWSPLRWVRISQVVASLRVATT
jgi:hypothetical protein